MKTVSLLFFLCCLLLTTNSYAQQKQIKFPQFTVRLDYGKIGIPEGNMLGIPGDGLYKSVVDNALSLLKKNSNNTSALFILALMKSQKIALNAPT